MTHNGCSYTRQERLLGYKNTLAKYKESLNDEGFTELLCDELFDAANKLGDFGIGGIEKIAHGYEDGQIVYDKLPIVYQFSFVPEFDYTDKDRKKALGLAIKKLEKILLPNPKNIARIKNILANHEYDSNIPDSIKNLGEIRKYKLTKELSIPGIYFLMNGNDVVYIGLSKTIYSRVKEHIKDPEKPFEQAFFMPIPESELGTTETALIRRFNPPLNKAKKLKTA